jgi:hypothetical protein
MMYVLANEKAVSLNLHRYNTEQERALLALTEAVKELYVRHVDAFVNTGKQLMGGVGGQVFRGECRVRRWHFSPSRYLAVKTSMLMIASNQCPCNQSGTRE